MVKEDGSELSITCNNDPHFYSICGTAAAGRITNNQLHCGTYICRVDKRYMFSFYHMNEVRIPCESGCENNVPAVEAYCEEESAEENNIPGCKIVCSGNSTDCADDGFCNGYRYGVFCPDLFFGADKYFHPKDICSGNPVNNCRNVVNCDVTEGTEAACSRSQFYGPDKLVPIFNYTRCSTLRFDGKVNRYCSNFMDQTNCSDPATIGGQCDINGYLTSVTHLMTSICEVEIETALCDDLLDTKCVQASPVCFVHKHKMCDNVPQCPDKSDETALLCESLTDKTCKRRFGVTDEELPIPLEWLHDKVKDCIGGIDETEPWPQCGQGDTERFSSEDDPCENVYLCKTQSPGFAELKFLCDGRETCGNENEVCSTSRTFRETIETRSLAVNMGHEIVSPLCLDGLESFRISHEVKCLKTRLDYPVGEIFGKTETIVTFPEEKQSCTYRFGENYLYTSCLDKCEEGQCPLTTIPSYKSCPGQFPQRVGTLVNNKTLTFLTRSHGGFSNRYFVCANEMRCIDFKDVCNLVNDCGDWSDEQMCENHFQCNNSILIPHNKLCDGVFDCLDLSDECNSNCSKFILEDTFLKGFSIAIGGSAIIANSITVIKNLHSIKSCRTWTALLNKCLVASIAVGDFMVGSYLLSVSVYDGLIYGKDYCQDQNKWLTSAGCSVLGVVSTVGSQLSLFSMVALSLVRIYGIINSMRIPGEVTVKKSLLIASGVGFIVAASVAVAVFPIAESFEDFFVNGFKFPEDLKIFIGLSSKRTVMDVIEKYYGRMRNGTLKWKMANKMIDDMFSHDPSPVQDYTEQKVRLGFYGNDGVCLFKFFVQPADPQRTFVWSVLALNFLCFIIISICYVAISISTSRSSQNITQGNKQLQQRNARMNRKIAFIIATDFLCWIPFIVVCTLHSLEAVDATNWYALFSIIILPINSIINPLLYDDTVTTFLVTPFQRLSTRVTETSVVRWISERTGSVREEPGDHVEMERKQK